MLQAQVAELEVAQRQLSAIENSTSWKMTHPLRRLMQATFLVRPMTIELATRAWHLAIDFLPSSTMKARTQATVSQGPVSLLFGKPPGIVERVQGGGIAGKATANDASASASRATYLAENEL